MKERANYLFNKYVNDYITFEEFKLQLSIIEEPKKTLSDKAFFYKIDGKPHQLTLFSDCPGFCEESFSNTLMFTIDVKSFIKLNRNNIIDECVNLKRKIWGKNINAADAMILINKHEENILKFIDAEAGKQLTK